MSEADLNNHLSKVLQGLEVDPASFDAFASQLVWRIGRTSEDAPLTIRVGLATSTPQFEDLPKLHNASDAEMEAAMNEQDYRVEWVGRFPE